MACFIVPATEAVVTTVIEKVVKEKEKKSSQSVCETTVQEVQHEKRIPVSVKLGWLNNMLWGGSALLAFEHVWHGEVIPYFPFLTVAGNAADTAVMLREMATSGVAMAMLVTLVWAGMVAVSTSMEKRRNEQDEMHKQQIN